MNREANIRDYYSALFRQWGAQHWWPAQSRFEVILGAILTQNTSWTNVEKAMASLRKARALNPTAIRKMPLAQLQKLIRSSGYFRQKARRLKNFVTYLDSHYGGSLQRMFGRPTSELRAELLELNGIGPETADSILLYAGGHPVFVVDTYTRRILARHHILPEKAKYEDVRSFFERALSEEADYPAAEQLAMGHTASRMSTSRRSALAQRYSEMHGLIVRTAKHHCFKKEARCEGCPLHPFLPVPRPR